MLGLSGLTHVVWLEGINDLGGGHTVESIEAGYQSIVATLHAHAIKVMGATMTSALGMLNPDEGWYPGYTGGADNGPVVDANRMILNSTPISGPPGSMTAWPTSTRRRSIPRPAT